MVNASILYLAAKIHYLDFGSQSTVDIRHVSGADNPVAHVLSGIK